LLDTRYAFISAYLKGEEAKILTSSHVNSMSKASTAEDALGIIGETDIGSYLEGVIVKTFGDLDKYLWVYLDECLERLKWFKPVPADILKILDAYIVKYDVLNVKAALQGISTGRKANMIPVGVIHNHGLLDDLCNAGDVDGIIKLLTECKLESYTSVLKECKIDERAKLRFVAEAKLDGEYYKNLVSITRGVNDGSILSKAFSIIIDMTNLQIMLRAIIGGIDSGAAEYTISGGYMLSEAVIRDLVLLKLADIPSRLENTQYHNVVAEVISNYDRSKNITAVEEIIEKHKFRLSKEILSPRVLSPLVVVWYLIIKEIEIRNLRLILKAMFDNMPIAEIRNYLVLSS
jgi:V/A-type H+/Na+-transporting ATPase subunit C